MKRRSFMALGFLLGVSALLNLIVAFTAATTTDEEHHVGYGQRVLACQPDHYEVLLSDSQMPISALNGIPLIIGKQLDKHGLLHPIAWRLQHFKAARLATILAALILDLLVYFWSCELYGQTAGLAACLLAVLSPNLIAHGSLATTDMYHAVGVLGSLFFFRRFLLRPNWARALICGVVLAFAQTTKSFALALYAVVALGLMFAMLRRTAPQPLPPGRAVGFVVIVATCFLGVMNLVYSFDNSFLPLSSYRFESSLFNRLQQTPLLRHIAVPVPYPFLQGLDLTKHTEETGRNFGNVYLLGQLGDTSNPAFHGFKSYYAVALFFKQPIAIQVLFLWGLIWICRHRSLSDFVRGEGLLLTSAAILFFGLSFFSRAQIGIRHILPVLAIETVIAGAAFSNLSLQSKLQKCVLATLVLWLGISVASYYPQMIPYMNEWLHDRRFAYKLLADSNLDWGQNRQIVDEFLRKNPDVRLDPARLVAGRVLVGANRLTGVYRWDSATYMQRYEPVAQVGYADFLFIVPEKDVPTAPQVNVPSDKQQPTK